MKPKKSKVKQHKFAAKRSAQFKKPQSSQTGSATNAPRIEVFRQARELHHQLDYIRKHVDKLWEQTTTTNERLQDLEIQVNLISRLITLLCIEKLGMKLRLFRRLVRRVEKETIADLQIHHLEELYRLEPKRPSRDK